jgi:alpha-glucosidase
VSFCPLYRKVFKLTVSLPIEEEGYVRTLWTRDAYGVPSRTNLYGAHPIYVNQKTGQNASASGVFFLNSNGMDIKFPEGGKQIEYNILGGVVDLFFLNGPTPADVARQGTQVWGVPAEVPYWSLGVSFDRTRECPH